MTDFLAFLAALLCFGAGVAVVSGLVLLSAILAITGLGIMAVMTIKEAKS